MQVSGDEMYKEKAYRSLNWVTYCDTEEGLVTESPVSSIDTWWSIAMANVQDVLSGFAGIPEFAPPHETIFCIQKEY